MISLQFIIPLGCLAALSSALPWNDQLDVLRVVNDGSTNGDCQSVGARGRGYAYTESNLGASEDILASCSGVLGTVLQTIQDVKSSGSVNLDVWSSTGGHSDIAESLLLESSFEADHLENSGLGSGSDNSFIPIEPGRLAGAISGNVGLADEADVSELDSGPASGSPNTGVEKRPKGLGPNSLGNKMPTDKGDSFEDPTESSQVSGSQNGDSGTDVGADDKADDGDDDEAGDEANGETDDEANTDANADDDDDASNDDDISADDDDDASDDDDVNDDDDANIDDNANSGDNAGIDDSDDSDDDANADDDDKKFESQIDMSRRKLGSQDDVTVSKSSVASPRPSKVPPGHTHHIGVDSDEGEE